MTEWLTATEAARHCRISVRTFRSQVKAGLYPTGQSASRRRKVWSAAALDAALSGVKHDAIDESDPIMAAIHAAENAAAAHRANTRQGAHVPLREDQRTPNLPASGRVRIA